jgi:hypothetical protein
MNNNKTYILFVVILLSLTSKSYSQHALFQGLGDFTGGSFNSSAQGISVESSVKMKGGETND